MCLNTPEPYDVIIVGGGPAGLSACLELSKFPGIKTAVIENEKDIGGIPRSAHVFFGMRDQKKLLTGKKYADYLAYLVNKTKTDVFAQSTVINIRFTNENKLNQLTVTSSNGLEIFLSRFIILATGCYEKSREKRLLAGDRPAGIFTTGTLQKLVNIGKLKPGKKAIILGTEHVSLSAALTLMRAGTKIIGMVEEKSDVQTYKWPAFLISNLLNINIFKNKQVVSIIGSSRVEGIRLKDNKSNLTFEKNCDTIVVTGKFTPDSSLILNNDIIYDNITNGPKVDLNYETPIKNVFAAGNILRGANMHDLCAIEGRTAARSIIKRIKGIQKEEDQRIFFKPEYPVRFVVPQIISFESAKKYTPSIFKAGVNIQVDYSMKNIELQVCSNNKILWQKKMPKIIGNSSVKIPIEKIDWDAVDINSDLVVRCSYR